jgi:hypothetical protein
MRCQLPPIIVLLPLQNCLGQFSDELRAEKGLVTRNAEVRYPRMRVWISSAEAERNSGSQSSGMKQDVEKMAR